MGTLCINEGKIMCLKMLGDRLIEGKSTGSNRGKKLWGLIGSEYRGREIWGKQKKNIINQCILISLRPDSWKEFC